MCMSVLHACRYVYCVCLVPAQIKERFGSPGTCITEDWDIIQVLETESRSSTRELFNYWAILLVPVKLILKDSVTEFLCMCVYMWTYMCAYMPAYTHTGQRYQVLSSTTLHLVFKQSLWTWSSTAEVGWLAISCLCLSMLVLQRHSNMHSFYMNIRDLNACPLDFTTSTALSHFSNPDSVNQMQVNKCSPRIMHWASLY